MRTAAKRLLELALVHGGIASIARGRRAGQVLVLAYHNIVPSGERSCGDRSLHLPQRLFADQLDALAETHDIIALGRLLDGGAADSRAGRPWAVITFDDAYHGALSAGIEEVVSRRLPATIFVPPYFVGGRTFWWDDAAESMRELDAATRERFLTELRGEDQRIRAALSQTGRRSPELPAHARCADEALLSSVAMRPGVTFGSHSWAHPNLARLSNQELATELGESLEWLQARFSNVLPVLSFPYGLDSAEARRVAAEQGYRAAMRISGGWVTGAERDPFSLPRVDIPSGLSASGFRLRTSGVIGG